MNNARDLEEYSLAYTYDDHPVLPATRMVLRHAVAQAEAQIIIHPHVRDSDTRILSTNFEDPTDPLKTIVVIRNGPPTAPRATLNRNAPKRPHLLRRLWSALR
jgi:hypothetical protein